MFNCSMCGNCCRSLNKSELFDDLNRGDGVCKYFIEESNKCSIYENRPIKCNVDKFYDIFLKEKIDKEKYYEVNYVECEKLKLKEE